MNLVCIMVGGPVYRIQAGGRWFAFEMHPYCGPCPVRRDTHEELTRDPGKAFWDAIERWCANDEQVSGDEAIAPAWCPSCTFDRGSEVRALGGKHFEIVGKCKQCGGSGLIKREYQP